MVLNEPPLWFLVFQRKARTRWLSFIAMGRFKHVLAFAWLPDAQCWLIYDVTLGRTKISLGRDEPATWAVIEGLRAGNVTLRIAGGVVRRRWLRVGFWCVPAMAHLAGVGGCALRPDAFYRQCLRHGAEIEGNGRDNNGGNWPTGWWQRSGSAHGADKPDHGTAGTGTAGV
jgi:hypothetical protein